MLAEGMALETVLRITGLSEADIRLLFTKILIFDVIYEGFMPIAFPFISGKFRISLSLAASSAISTTLNILCGIYDCVNSDNKETCDMAYQTVNPANNQLIKEYPAHSDADVEAALQAADALYHSPGRKAILTSACRCCISWPI
jgi:hypothetical protein